MSTILDISIPNFAKLNNDEYTQFLKGVVKLVSTASTEKLAVKEELFKGIQAQIELLTEASRQSRASQETESLSKIDKERSQALSYLISSFKLERKNPIASKQEAALALHKEFKSYTGTHNLPMRQKSQAIDALLKDLDKPEFSKHIRTLGLAQVVASLNETNLKYEEVAEMRADNQSSAPIIKVKEVRKEAQENFKELLRFAFSNNVINPSEESTTFMRLLNKLVLDTMKAYKQRRAHLSATKTEKNSETEKDSVSEQNSTSGM
ncbi:DUF6261 family protein [Capnocytophaga sp.]|uniref:DUF6261 family protein n=1 Tax=Capnocytophaga sp. TaxID=44737 RepID=UPI0026DABAF3|nr:DUF6261 family protein [Capnocytophaga sp.]MDO5105360.1 DUF6261 family protein [Capnocytophaga sp.]